MSSNLLSVCDLRTYLSTEKGVVRAVDGVSIKIDERDYIGLVGESGCGKSTIALSILRLLPPSGKIVGGSILLRGKNILELSEVEMRDIRREISIVFQDPGTSLNPVIKIGHQIAETIEYQGKTKEEKKKEVIDALRMVRMPSPSKVFDSYPHELSGGMKQRAQIAMAIISNPSLLIADEPTTALDATVQILILDLIRDLKEKHRMSLFIISHDLGVISEICDYVYVMYAGHICESADVHTIFKEPKHPYTRGLLRCTLRIDKYMEIVPTIPGIVPNLIDPHRGCIFNPRCPKVMDICKEQKPPLIELEHRHLVSCFMVR